MTQPQPLPPGLPPPVSAQPTPSQQPRPLIPQWIVVVIAGGLLVTYMAANNYTGAEAIGVTIVLGIGALIVVVTRALVRLGDKPQPSVVVVNSVAAPPPPGWYLDPHGATRWFDGRNWTEQVLPQGPPPGKAPQQPNDAQPSP